MVSAQSGLPEPLTLHPAQSSITPNGWNRALGQFGESLVRNLERVRGNTVFNLNVGEHGIDGLVCSAGPEGKVEYKLIEVKTLQNGTEFQLGDSKLGKQLSHPVIEDRLATAAAKHPDAATRKAAAEALDRFRANPASLKTELHGISVGDNRYIVRAVDSATGKIGGEIASPRLTDVLKNLGERASDEEVRRMATRHLAEFDQVQMASKPRIVKGDDLTRDLAKLAGVEEKQMTSAVMEAAEHIRAPGQSRWVKSGGKMLKFVGRAAGPAGLVIGASLYTVEAADIEQRFDRGEISREQADAEQAKLAVNSTAIVGGGFAGMATGAAIGTFLCPGPGTVIGGVVGAVAGCVGVDIVMAASGLSDSLGEFLQPGVETIRRACSYMKEKGIEVKLAAREKLREWVGAETFDQATDALDAAGTWTLTKAKESASAIKQTAVVVRDNVVECAKDIGDAVSDGATWSLGKANNAYRLLRRQFD